jgi:Tfp pilus assembly protein PilX
MSAKRYHSCLRSNIKTWQSQQGIALLVAMIILLAITLIGLAGSRSTGMQQRMTANFHDRAVAFQTAETAVEVAENIALSRTLNTDGTYVYTSMSLAEQRAYFDGLESFVDCSSSTENQCAFNVDDSYLQDMTVPSSSSLLASDVDISYIIQLMGEGVETGNATASQSGQCLQYPAAGCEPPNVSSMYLRVTVTVDQPDRARVKLQSVVKRTFS